MIRSFPFLVLLLCIGVAAASCQGNDSFDSRVQSARDAQRRGDFAAAASYYQSAAALRPNVPELWSNLGLMQNVTGNYKEAIMSFQKAERLKPGLYVPNLFLGIDYLHIQQPQQAIPFLEKAERLNPRDARTPLTLGRAYASLRDYAAAGSAYRRALDLDPTNSSAWFDFGIATLNEVEMGGRMLSGEAPHSAYARALYAESLGEQLRFKEAITELQAVLAVDPHFPCAHAQLGLFYLAEQQVANAAQEFAAEAQNCGLAGLGQAELRIQAGDNVKAFSLLNALWKQDPGFLRANVASLVNNVPEDRKVSFSDFVAQLNGKEDSETELYNVLAAALRGGSQDESARVAEAEQPRTATRAEAQADDSAGHYGLCVRDLTGNVGRAGKVAPSDATRSSDSDLLLANCAFMAGDYDLAAKASDRVVGRLPHDAAARYWSVKANERLAVRAFGRFEQLDPNSERTHLMLGDMYRQRQRFEQAESEYKEASLLAPRDTAPLFGLASAYLQDAKEYQALAIARTALDKNPDDPDFNLLTGEILIAGHEWSDAEAYLKRGMGAKPQMLPHLHVLLGEVYENTNRPQQAIAELLMGASSDETGGAYYQLARLYMSEGNKAAAEDAFAHTKDLEKKRRERAVIAVEDDSDVMQSDIH
ncbi:MAG: tetratricopeptide repeat protein [Terracidiphilus sp.]